MKGHLLIVNPEGLNRYEGLYSALELLGWSTAVFDADEPALINWCARVRGFRPNVQNWRHRVGRVRNRLCRTPLAFVYKSWRYNRALAEAALDCDLILQVGGMFAHYWPAPRVPYTVFCDCTVKLGEGEPLSGVDFGSPDTAHAWYALERSLYRNAEYVFPTSQLARRSLMEDYGVDDHRIHVVGSAANLQAPDPFRPDYEGRTVLYVGYDFERKGGPILLRAFSRVLEEIPDARLRIAGPASLPYRLPPNTELLGRQTRTELSAAYARSSVFVMPSLFEPFAIALLEAMDHALPCIGTDRGTMSEVITEGQTGLISPAGDSDALAERLVYLLRRPELMREMGERGRDRARRDFTWPIVASKMDARLVEVLKRRRQRVAEGLTVPAAAAAALLPPPVGGAAVDGSA